VLRASHIEQAGGAVVVRFLEQGQDVNVYDMHEYKVPSDKARGGFFTKRKTCPKDSAFGNPNADCPMCRAGLAIKPRTAFNLIQRQRPVLRKGQDGKALKDNTGNWIIDGYMDDVVYIDVANKSANFFRQCDNNFRGLMSRDLILGLSGDNFQPYTLAPADIDAGPQPMSEDDHALAAKKKNLDEVFAPPQIQEAASIVAKYGANSGASGTTQGLGNTANAQPNQFLAPATQSPGQAISGGAFAAAQQSQPDK
jgi:hypothetical protein